MKLKYFQQKGTRDYDSLQQGLKQGNSGSTIQQVKQCRTKTIESTAAVLIESNAS